MRFSIRPQVLAVVFAAGTTAALGQQCTPEWTLRFAGTSGLGRSDVLCVAVFDGDGPGPAPPELIAGGTFTLAGDQPARFIARWDGVAWLSLGGGLDEAALALAVFDEDGPGPASPALFVACRNRAVMKWNGEAWASLGFAAPSEPAALTVFDEDGSGPLPAALFVGGGFTSIGGVQAHGIARWNGAAWSALGTGIAGWLRALVTHDPDGPGLAAPVLVAGGSFSSAGGVSASRVAQWNGSQWSAMPGLGGQEVDALASLTTSATGEHLLIARGMFTLGGPPSPFGQCAKWNGSTWSAMGTVPSSLSVAPVNGVAVLLGGFGLNAPFTLQSWDGAAWTTLATDADAPFNVATAFDPDGKGSLPASLIAAGAFRTIGQTPARSIARLDGGTWAPLGSGLSGPTGGRIDALCAVESPVDAVPRGLYAAGVFHRSGDLGSPQLARWDGSAWRSVGQGTGASMQALALFDPDGPGPAPSRLVCAGSGGSTAPQRIGAWDESGWASLGSGLDQTVRALVVFDEDGAGPNPARLFAGGDFSTAFTGPSIPRIARWDGQAWTGVGAPLTGGSVMALAVHDDGSGPSLFAGGTFAEIGGVLASRIARWDGASWHPLGSGVGTGIPSVNAIAAFDEDGPGPLPPALFIGGSFSTAGGAPASNIARWDGNAWSPLGPGFHSVVRGLHVFDDGRGPALFATGGQAGFSALSYLGRWDGTAWTPLGEGLNGDGRAFATFDPDGQGPAHPALFVGGYFSAVDGLPSTGLAAWACPTCYPNCDNSTTAPILNVQDFTCFLNAFASGDSHANCDASTIAPVLNVQDFTCFLNAFASGCP